MHFAYHNGELVVEETENDLIKNILAREGIHTTSGQLTPELLTAGHDRPFSFLSVADRIEELLDILQYKAPLNELAHDRVLDELEHIVREGTEHAPADLHPNDGDSHTVALKDWLHEHVATDQFSDEVWSNVETELQDKLRHKVSTLWEDVSEEIGNPATATTTQLQGEIRRLKND